MKKKKWC